jgi:hypothetical protein
MKHSRPNDLDDRPRASAASPEPASPRARRITTPSWLDARLVLGLALVLGSVLAGAKIVSGASRTHPTVTARRDLAAGTILTPSDLTIARVQLPGHGSGVYVARLDDAVGKELARPVSAGELVPVGALAAVSARTTVTVPLAFGAAPQLRKGQRIELWLSTSSCSSMVLLADVTVQAVHDDSSGSFSTGSDGQDVVVSVAPRLADRVIEALALDEAQLRAGILVGHGTQARPDESPALPDLAACASTAIR